MTRVVSGAVLVALLLLAIWRLPWWVTGVLAVLTAARGGVELASLAARVDVAVSRGFVGTAAGVLALAFAFSDPRSPVFVDHGIAVAFAALVLASGVMALAAPPSGQATFARAGVSLLAPVYLGVPLGALLWVHLVAGPAALTWLVAVIAVSDSSQYYAGRLAGRRPLSPVISPKKTVEGAIGGFIGAAAAGGIGAVYLLPAVPAAIAAAMALLLAAAGMAGDLFESLLKRSAGAKDSAALIPGHGGVLDRIDSYLFAAPLFYLILAVLSYEF
jgi:phosphatidate cytidylyltransferase